MTQLGLRMARGASPLAVTGHEASRQRIKEARPTAAEFIEAAHAALGSANPDQSAAAFEAAKFFGVRALAEGTATTLQSAIALRLFLNDASADGLHGQCVEGFQALYASAPLSPEMEKIVPFLTQLELALEALPAHRGVQFVGLNVPTPSGKLTEALNGDKGIGSFYPGGSMVWRGCASATTDPMLAKQRAMAGAGVALVLKIRSNSSRDVSAFVASPDLGERLFLPRRRFRVAAIHALEDSQLRRGLASTGSRGGAHALLDAFEAPGLTALGSGAASSLPWEDACNRRAVCVVLDEEDAPSSAALGGGGH